MHMHTHAHTYNLFASISSLVKVFVSVVFVCEVVGLVVFHLANTNQHSLFLRNPYYWYLAVLAVGGLVAAIPVPPLYDPKHASTGFAIFQVGELLLLFPHHVVHRLGSCSTCAYTVSSTLHRRLLGYLDYCGLTEPSSGSSSRLSGTAPNCW